MSFFFVVSEIKIELKLYDIDSLSKRVFWRSINSATRNEKLNMRSLQTRCCRCLLVGCFWYCGQNFQTFLKICENSYQHQGIMLYSLVNTQPYIKSFWLKIQRQTWEASRKPSNHCVAFHTFSLQSLYETKQPHSIWIHGDGWSKQAGNWKDKGYSWT